MTSFGSPMPGRQFSAGSPYKYGFNSMEKSDEVFGSDGTSYTAEFWQYDARLGRRWNLDPKPHPSISQYACFANNPIWFSDPLGDTIRLTKDFMANKSLMKAYDIWSKSDAGKEFLTKYDKGGEFEHVAMVFDAKSIYDMGEEGFAKAEILNTKDGKNAFDITEDKMTDEQKNELQQTVLGKSDSKYVKYTITLRSYQGWSASSNWANIGNFGETIGHEKQHIDIIHEGILKQKRYIGRFESHDRMYEMKYVQERENNYWMYLKYWAPYYINYKRIEYKRDIFKFVHDQVNDYVR